MKLPANCIIGILILFNASILFSQSGYLKLPDIKGESTERAHKDWIEVISISQGLEQLKSSPGSSRQRTNAVFTDFIITKPLDRATPYLMRMAASGKVAQEMELEMVTSGRVYYRITLKNVKIKSIKTESICKPDCKLVDEVAFGFSKIIWRYTDSSGDEHEVEYDVASGI